MYYPLDKKPAITYKQFIKAAPPWGNREWEIACFGRIYNLSNCESDKIRRLKSLQLEAFKDMILNWIDYDK